MVWENCQQVHHAILFYYQHLWNICAVLVLKAIILSTWSVSNSVWNNAHTSSLFPSTVSFVFGSLSIAVTFNKYTLVPIVVGLVDLSGMFYLLSVLRFLTRIHNIIGHRHTLLLPFWGCLCVGLVGGLSMVCCRLFALSLSSLGFGHVRGEDLVYWKSNTRSC